MDPTNPFDNLSAFGSLSPQLPPGAPMNITPQQPAPTAPQQTTGNGLINLLMGGSTPQNAPNSGGVANLLSRLINNQPPQAPQQQQQPQQQAMQQQAQPGTQQGLQPQQIQMAQPMGYRGMLSLLNGLGH